MNTGTDWMEQGRRLVDVLRSALADAPATSGDHASDCRWCPVCQAAAVVRGERPEVTAALADVLTTAAAALRTFAAEHASPGVAETDAEPAGEDHDPPAAQQIEIA
jgi:hypothetical protein